MVDFNQLRERLSSLNKSGTAKNSGRWKPKDEHQVRGIPHDDFMKELFFHNQIGIENEILCPKMNYGEECAICDFCDLLKSWKDSDGQDKPEVQRKQDWALYKKISAAARVFMPIIERGQQGQPDMKEAAWWGMTPNQCNKALEECMDGDRLSELGLEQGDPGSLRVLNDVKKGFDLAVSYAAPGKKGNTTDRTVVSVKARIRSSPLVKNAKGDLDEVGVEALVKTIKPLSEIFPKLSSDEVQKKFEKFVGSPENVAAKVNGNGKEYNKQQTPTNSKENVKNVGTRSIDEAFGDMLKEA